jgi:hypothetical protein
MAKEIEARYVSDLAGGGERVWSRAGSTKDLF